MICSDITLQPVITLNGTTPTAYTPLPEPLQPLTGSGGMPTPHEKEIAKRKRELAELRKANELLDVDEAILQEKVYQAQRKAYIANLETELHDLDLLAHRCEDCKRPLNERVDGKVKKLKNANASVCGDCTAHRKAVNEANARDTGKRTPTRRTATRK